MTTVPLQNVSQTACREPAWTRRASAWARRAFADRSRRGDDGNAIVEFVFVAVLIMVPLIYFVVAVAEIQRSSFAVTAAARDAGRAFATAKSTADARTRAVIAARLAEQDLGLPGDPSLSYVAAGDPCTAAAITPQLTPGAVFAICVRNQFALPGVPTVLSGRGVTTIGEYVVHVDDFRTVQ